MKQKQLANVLIKILGLSLCVQSLTHVMTGAFSLLSALMQAGRSYGSSYLWLNPLTGLALGIVGLLFIFLSQPLADLLFKDE
jgi:hypothetical protein